MGRELLTHLHPFVTALSLFLTPLFLLSFTFTPSRSPLPASQTPPLAVHRIHVLPCLRRFGIGSRLLDSVLSNGVYGIGASELVKMHGGRLGAVAFSQPTMAGRNLAEGWGRKGLKEGEGKGLVVFEE